MYNDNIVNSSLLEEKQCRICLDNDRQEELINPCLCKGTQMYVHRDCLNQWRSVNVNPVAFSQCTVCKYKYKIVQLDNGNIKKLEKINTFLMKNFYTFLFVNQFVIFILSFLMLIMDVNKNIQDLFIPCNNITETVYSFNSDYECLINYYILATLLYFGTIISSFLINFYYVKNKKLYIKYYKNANYKNCIFMIIVTIVAFIVWLPVGIFFVTLCYQALFKFHYDTIDKQIKTKNGIVLNYEDADEDNNIENSIENSDIEISKVELNNYNTIDIDQDQDQDHNHSQKISSSKNRSDDSSIFTKIDEYGNKYEEASV
tara:strand:- start:280 stop:1227 length:948 start_codon:yes stop_codon:yes gene_type:complete